MIQGMPRTNQDGKPIRRVLEWLLNRDMTDAEMAGALGIPAANYGRRKDHDDFPSFEELAKFGERFGVSSMMLQIAFGYLPLSVLSVLDEDGMNQYMEQGGDSPQPSLPCGTGKNGDGEKPSRPRADRLG